MSRLNRKTEQAPVLLSAIDFGMEIFKEKILDNGEDSYLYVFTPNKGVVGVFDGCGGSGARRYEKYQGKTGAYMASRVVSGAARDWFIDIVKEKETEDVSALQNKIKDYLALCQEIGGRTTALKGSISKDFPTTAAVILMSIENGGICATCFWAGDSRCYLLDAEGLKQLTEDDLGGLDAMENLTADGVLTNVISSSKDFTVHHKTIFLAKPAVLFTATDGCFGYFSTPMEFEHLLLSALYCAENAENWEAGISEVLQKVAGDDYSLSGAAVGFGSFKNLKGSFEKRYFELLNRYIKDLDGKNPEEKRELWLLYKPNYTKHLARG